MDKNLIFQKMTDYWNNDMPFNQLLGLEIKHFDVQRAEIKFIWQDKLIGYPTQKILHGGVTVSALDLAGGVMAAANIIDQLDDFSDEHSIRTGSKNGIA